MKINLLLFGHYWSFMSKYEVSFTLKRVDVCAKRIYHLFHPLSYLTFLTRFNSYMLLEIIIKLTLFNLRFS